MCKQDTALATICGLNKGSKGLSQEAIILAQAQCDDYKKMDGRMDKLEKDVVEVKKNLSENTKKIDQILQILQHRKSPISALKEVMSNKVFLYILITLVAAACGVEVGGLGVFLFK